MKEKIHPKYEQTTITCACGNVIETGSTKKDIRVEICSKCHPFFTGKQKLVDTGGRVDRFKKRYGMQENKLFFHRAAQKHVSVLFFSLVQHFYILKSNKKREGLYGAVQNRRSRGNG